MPTGDEYGFEEHQHDALVHSHAHFHVTHNWSDNARTFEHLASEHEHEHDHAEVQHAHLPHRDFDSEHRGEAHDHDHDEPVKERLPASEGGEVAAKKSTAKKSTAKKSTAKKTTAGRSTAGGGEAQGVPTD